jgi:hypothetical protein
VVAAAESYIGLVEFGVGLIPGGGGTKEMTLRTALKYEDGEPEFNLLRNTYMTISTAKVSTSAAEAFDLGFMRRGDEVVLNSNRVIAAAKSAAIDLADAGYTQPMQKTNIKVHGKGALAMFKTGVYAMQQGNYISTHDQLIADNYVVNTRGVEGGHLGHEVLDNGSGEVVGPGETEAATGGFAHGRTVACYDICGVRHVVFIVILSILRLKQRRRTLSILHHWGL